MVEETPTRSIRFVDTMPDSLFNRTPRMSLLRHEHPPESPTHAHLASTFPSSFSPFLLSEIPSDALEVPATALLQDMLDYSFWNDTAENLPRQPQSTEIANASEGLHDAGSSTLTRAVDAPSCPDYSTHSVSSGRLIPTASPHIDFVHGPTWVSQVAYCSGDSPHTLALGQSAPATLAIASSPQRHMLYCDILPSNDTWRQTTVDGSVSSLSPTPLPASYKDPSNPQDVLCVGPSLIPEDGPALRGMEPGFNRFKQARFRVLPARSATVQSSSLSHPPESSSPWPQGASENVPIQSTSASSFPQESAYTVFATKGQKRKATSTGSISDSEPLVGQLEPWSAQPRGGDQPILLPIPRHLHDLMSPGLRLCLYIDSREQNTKTRYQCTYVSPVANAHQPECPRAFTSIRYWERHYTTVHVKAEYEALERKALDIQNTIALRHPDAAVQTIKCCFETCAWQSKVGDRLDVTWGRHLLWHRAFGEIPSVIAADLVSSNESRSKKARHGEPAA